MASSPPTPSTPSLETVISTDMNAPIPPSIYTPLLSSPPFIPLPSTLNTRDLGLLPSSPIPPGLLYRSGAIHAAAPTTLSSLPIKMILDLRTAREQARDPTPAIPGVVNLHFGSAAPPSPVQMADFVADGGATAYAAMYIEILDLYAPSFRAAITWLRDERSPLLFHCTAGKDRTGVLAALLLSLAGASRDVVAFDYALTRVGVEPGREVLLQMLRLWNEEWSAETEGMSEFVQVKGEFVLALLERVDEVYGGVEGYVRDVLGFGEEDVRIVKSVLRGEVVGE
ncbi:hypothetical protein IQ07DRAFT_82691 [Pyrenochaeta sp. DS3sAY3a]|nr:hypothetical protein IQ07DRAFT_82691 [Pyrenochaeta sp. DS3sAY3a]